MDTGSSESGRDGRHWPRRIARFDWEEIRRNLDAVGFSRLPGLLDDTEAANARALFTDDARFRKLVDMDRHGYGSGDYRYLAAPLPRPVEALRRALYPPLAEIANEWSERLGGEAPYPAGLDDWLERCHAAGQTHPTPLLLRYMDGGFNRMHQDRYGDLVFPLQVVCLLSTPRGRHGADERGGFTGGEVLISEHRPRMQARVNAIPLALGEGLVFAASERPVPSARGFARATMRHGVSTVGGAERMTLGIIFHDAAS